MSKILNVNSGNYVVRVADNSLGRKVILDVGGTGTVDVLGNINITGPQTVVSSQDLNIKDNVIVLNDGETGSTVTLGTAGFRIDRGTGPDVQLLFDESITHNDPISQTNETGTFIFKDENNRIKGIYTNSIATGGGDLYLINSGAGVISVSGTADYENQITDDDDIPNKKYVDDAIVTGIQTIQIQEIARGDSALNIFDESLDGGVSALRIKIDGNERLLVKGDSTEIEGISFQDNTITSTGSSEILTIGSNGSPFVKIDGLIRLPIQDDSAAVASSNTHVAVYAKDPDKGKSGVWYKNRYDHEDELISTNRSLLYSMLF